jgi:hypothetical protein
MSYPRVPWPVSCPPLPEAGRIRRGALPLKTERYWRTRHLASSPLLSLLCSLVALFGLDLARRCFPAACDVQNPYRRQFELFRRKSPLPSLWPTQIPAAVAAGAANERHKPHEPPLAALPNPLVPTTCSSHHRRRWPESIPVDGCWSSSALHRRLISSSCLSSQPA